ncbi:MAG: LysR substrate-binding domain-containing protein [Rhodanobacter sp.]
MDLEALADFNAVASHGGFSAASRVTGRPKASLSRRVRQLEDALCVRLLERGARSLRLTAEGAALHEQTAVLLERIDDVAEALRQNAGVPRGRLRISAPVLLAHRGLGKIAADFAAAYPQVQLEITADDRFVDPLGEGYDLVIRANPQPTTELAGRCFLRDELILAAHPSLSPPATGIAGAAVPAVELSGASKASVWQLASPLGKVTLRRRPVLRLSSMVMVYDAVLAGIGAAMLPRSLVQADLDAGRLLEWGVDGDRHIEVWALYPPHRHVSRRVSLFVQMLVDRFAGGSPAAFSTLTEAAPAS